VTEASTSSSGTRESSKRTGVSTKLTEEPIQIQLTIYTTEKRQCGDLMKYQMKNSDGMGMGHGDGTIKAWQAQESMEK
jgi:hypothetical protein